MNWFQNLFEFTFPMKFFSSICRFFRDHCGLTKRRELVSISKAARRTTRGRTLLCVGSLPKCLLTRARAGWDQAPRVNLGLRRGYQGPSACALTYCLLGSRCAGDPGRSRGGTWFQPPGGHVGHPGGISAITWDVASRESAFGIPLHSLYSLSKLVIHLKGKQQLLFSSNCYHSSETCVLQYHHYS